MTTEHMSYAEMADTVDPITEQRRQVVAEKSAEACRYFTDHGRCTRTGTHDRGDGRLYCWQHIKRAMYHLRLRAAK